MPALSLRSWLVATFIAQLAVVSQAADLKLETETIGANNSNWRQIAIRITNQTGNSISVAHDTLKYYISDTSSGLVAQVFSFSNHLANGTVLNANPANVSVSEATTVSQTSQILGNKYIKVAFINQSLCAGCIIEAQFGVHRPDWSNINQSLDPSFVNSTSYTINSQVAWLHNYYYDNQQNLNAELTRRGVSPSSVVWTGSTKKRYGGIGDSVRIHKFNASRLSLSIAARSNGSVVNADSMDALDRRILKSRYGGLDAGLAGIANNMNNTQRIPVEFFAGPAVPNRQAILSLVSANNGSCAQSGLCKVFLNKAQLNSIGADSTFPIAVASQATKITNDLWEAAYRINIDQFLSLGYQGTGIRACVWEQQTPTFQSEMAVDQSQIPQASLGTCLAFPVLDSATCNNTGYFWDTAGKQCLQENFLPQSQCVGSQYYWLDESVTEAPSQHVAYMLAMIKNNRINKTAPAGSPTTYGGTGFAPGAYLMDANFPGSLSDQGSHEYAVNALQWATTNNADVISQSWHNDYSAPTQALLPLPTSTITTLPLCDTTSQTSYMDRVTDYIAQQPPYPVICQAAGNTGLGSDPVVNHKGLNTIIVGQDNRDGYQVVQSSSWLNPASGIELPHVTVGVNQTLDGVTPFDNTDGTFVHTLNGGTSMAAAMANGFVADLLSINPTSLKGQPWLIRAMLMASADNLESVWWDDQSTIDKKGGAGRINGINASFMALSPYNSASPSPFGFSNGVVATGSQTSQSFLIAPTTTGVIRIGLSWFGQVNPSDLSEILTDLDLVLTDPTGAVVATSSSLVNPVEMIHANVVAGNIYTATVTVANPAKYDTHFGIAWCNR